MKRGFAIGLMMGAGCFGATGAAAATTDAAEAAPETTVPALDTALAVDETQTGTQAPAPEPAAAVDAPDVDASSSNWEASFTPYLWLAGTAGNVGVPKFGQGVEIDKSFADMLSNLNFAFMGAVDARRKRFVMRGDLMYLSMTAKAENILNQAFLSGRVDAKTTIATASIGVRVVDQGPLFLDVLVGGRIIGLNVDMKLTGPNQTFSYGTSPSNVSPLIGARLHVPLGEKWGLGVYGDVGGLLHNTDVKWQALATIQYDISRRWTAIAGYRHMQIHHESQRLDFDVNMNGPLLGFSYKF